jgi:hypothetical protein
MKLDRRHFLVASSGLVATTTLAACGEQPPKGVRDLASQVRDILSAHFGKPVARAEASRAFALDLATGIVAPCASPWPACETLEARTLLNFLQSTNYLAHARTGEELNYLSMYDPYATPCASQLVIPA